MSWYKKHECCSHDGSFCGNIGFRKAAGPRGRVVHCVKRSRPTRRPLDQSSRAVSISASQSQSSGPSPTTSWNSGGSSHQCGGRVFSEQKKGYSLDHGVNSLANQYRNPDLMNANHAFYFQASCQYHADHTELAARRRRCKRGNR